MNFGPIHFHEWSKWTFCARGNIRDRHNSHIGYYEKQSRECTECGLIQLRTEQALANH